MTDDVVKEKIDEYTYWIDLQINTYEIEGEIKDYIQLKNFINTYCSIKNEINMINKYCNNINYKKYCEYLIYVMNSYDDFVKNINLKNTRSVKLNEIKKIKK